MIPPPILTAPCLRCQARTPPAPADPVPVVGSKRIPEPKRLQGTQKPAMHRGCSCWMCILEGSLWKRCSRWI
uniref:Uncharacterized protein n=1 Tax=Mustela putorius furo TaxID=9669 RepID=M3XRD8_MUSPF